MGISLQAKITKILLRVHFFRLLRQPYLKQREIQENFNRRTGILPRDIEFESVEANGVPAAWVSAPESLDDAVILYFHGGAYYSGSILTHREFAARIVKTTGLRMLLVDYRLAPEHPYPAALEDAVAAYRWLLAAGYDPAKIIIAGDSAGGGLALATLLTIRDANDPLPAGAVCFSPWTDLTVSGESCTSYAKVELVCKPEFLNRSAQWYAGEHDLKSPLISPLFADLRALPPMLIFVGGEETLLDDSTRLKVQAQESGVDVTLEIWPEMFHIFPIVGYLPEAKRALTMLKAFTAQILS